MSLPTPAQAAGNPRRTRADFLELDDALETGNLERARRSFARLLVDSPGLAEALEASRSPFRDQPANRLALLDAALQIGDLGRARAAFARLLHESLPNRELAARDTGEPFAATRTFAYPV